MALLLAIDLLFLPWWSANRGLVIENSVSSTATGAPDGWLGVLALLAALWVIADLALDRMGSATLPVVGGSRSGTRIMAAFAAAVCVAFKFILHISFTATYWDYGFWFAVVLAAALLLVSALALQADGADVVN